MTDPRYHDLAGALPFLFMVFVSMFLVYVFPQIAMWLPDLIYH